MISLLILSHKYIFSWYLTTHLQLCILFYKENSHNCINLRPHRSWLMVPLLTHWFKWQLDEISPTASWRVSTAGQGGWPVGSRASRKARKCHMGLTGVSEWLSFHLCPGESPPEADAACGHSPRLGSPASRIWGDLRRSWYSNNRNQVPNECNALESPGNHPLHLTPHPLTPGPWENCLSRKRTLAPKGWEPLP